REDIVRRYFAPAEQQEFFSLPDEKRARAFFKYWTRKEAFVKARGSGLFSGLDQFEVALDAPRLLRADGGIDSGDWWMAELPSIAGYEAAVVVNAPSCVARFYKWRLLAPAT